MEEFYGRWLDEIEWLSHPRVVEVRDSSAGLEVQLDSEGSENRLVVKFESVVGYRNINESYRSATWRRLENRWIGGCYRVRESNWVVWLRQESDGVLDEVDLKHYCIFTDEDCVEVVTEFEPVVSEVSRSSMKFEA